MQREPRPLIYPGDIRFAFAVLALAGLLLILLVLTCIGAFFMKRPLLIGCAVACLTLGLSACGSTGTQMLTNLQGCERHYNGVVAGGLTGGSFSGSVKVDCPTDAQAAPVSQ